MICIFTQQRFFIVQCISNYVQSHCIMCTRVVVTFLYYIVHICKYISDYYSCQQKCVKSMILSECNTNLPCPCQSDQGNIGWQLDRHKNCRNGYIALLGLGG